MNKFKTLPINDLVPHEKNPNEMSEEIYEKIKKHIEGSGKYEAITVRPFGDKYQVLNGYHRLCVLKELGYTEVDCQIWQVDDRQALLYLTTLNRLKGTDDVTKRATLLAELAKEYGSKDILELIPESERAMDSLLKSLNNDGIFDLETEKGLLEEKLIQLDVDDETAKRLADNYQPNSRSVSIMKFVFKDIREYNRAIEYFGRNADTKLLIDLLNEHEEHKKG